MTFDFHPWFLGAIITFFIGRRKTLTVTVDTQAPQTSPPLLFCF